MWLFCSIKDILKIDLILKRMNKYTMTKSCPNYLFALKTHNYISTMLLHLYCWGGSYQLGQSCNCEQFV